MRSTILLGCVLWIVVAVHSFSTVDRENSGESSLIQKRQVFQDRSNAYDPRNQTQQFQWVKVNNQWVRSDGTKLPGYSQANVPYNQPSNQWNTPSHSPTPTQPTGVGNPAQRPGQPTPSAVIPQQPQGAPRRQDSKTEGSLGWNPNADRELTQDKPQQTTPRPVPATTRVPVLPQAPPTAYNPPSPTRPINAPFGSGQQQRPAGGQNRWNPDASLTYGTGGRNAPPRYPSNQKPQPQPPRAGGSNPWSNL